MLLCVTGCGSECPAPPAKGTTPPLCPSHAEGGTQATAVNAEACDGGICGPERPPGPRLKAEQARSSWQGPQMLAGVQALPRLSCGHAQPAALHIGHQRLRGWEEETSPWKQPCSVAPPPPQGSVCSLGARDQGPHPDAFLCVLVLELD